MPPEAAPSTKPEVAGESVRPAGAPQTVVQAASLADAPANLSAVPGAPGRGHVATGHPVVSGVPLGAVPLEIGLKTLAGISRFDIRLNPDDLGRIEIRLDVRPDGAVQADIQVERPETLAALSRDARGLERALEQAGLRPGEGGLTVALKEPSLDAGAGWRGSGQDGGWRGPGAEGGGQGRQPSPDGGQGQGQRHGGAESRRAEVPGQDEAAPRPYLWRPAAGIDLHV